MSQQFIRKFGIVIGEGSKLLDVSQLRCVFNVEASTLHAPTTAYLRVYNLSDATAMDALNLGTKLYISAGYRENFAQIFAGEITQAWKGRENGTDTFVDITAADSDHLYNFGFVNLTVAAGTDVIGRIGQIAGAVGLKFGTIQAPPGAAKLARGRAYFGLARDHLTEEAASINAEWCIENGQLDVVNVGGYKPGDIPVITAATGMIGVPEQTELGISVRCLLNPFIKRNMRVQLDNKSIQQYAIQPNVSAPVQAALVPTIATDGIYKVLYVNHNGDTRGQDWYSDFVAYSKIVPNSGQLDYMPNATGSY